MIGKLEAAQLGPRTTQNFQKFRAGHWRSAAMPDVSMFRWTSVDGLTGVVSPRHARGIRTVG